MTATNETTTRHRAVVLTLAVVALVGLAVPAILAVRAAQSGADASATTEIGVNRLGTASLDVAVGSSGAALSAANLAPGDVVIGQVNVTNAGSLPLRYAATLHTDGGDLANWLLFDVWTSDQPCSTGWSPGDQTVVENLLLRASEVAVIGDAAPGPHPGERPLEPGAGEILCIRATLPIEAPNAAQGTTLGFDMVIDAEHDIEPDQP